MNVPSVKLLVLLAQPRMPLRANELAEAMGYDKTVLSRIRGFLRDQSAIRRAGKALGLDYSEIFVDGEPDPADDLAEIASELED
jgi:DNA-binding IclR family transcriptional regulator